MTNGGYEEARRLLEKRYDNQDKIVAAYIEKVLNWPNIPAHNIDSFD